MFINIDYVCEGEVLYTELTELGFIPAVGDSIELHPDDSETIPGEYTVIKRKYYPQTKCAVITCQPE